MYHVSAQGVNERMINVHYFYYQGDVKMYPAKEQKAFNVDFFVEWMRMLIAAALSICH